MRTRILLILISYFGLSVFGQDAEFGLLQVLKKTQVVGGDVFVRVSTKGTVPPSINDTNDWFLQMTEDGENGRSITVHPDEATLEAATHIVTLKIGAAKLRGLIIPKASWSAAFIDDSHMLNASEPESVASGLKAAKNRDEADLYGNFSFLSGVGTSPIWVIDVKAGYADTLQRLLRPHTPGQQPGRLQSIKTGIFADIQTNTDTKPPVDRTEIDPDSIRAFWKFFETKRIGHRIFSMYWEVQPAGGEFNRSNPSSNFVAEGKLRFDIVPFNTGRKRVGTDFDPQIGMELGKNLNKPSTLFGQPVNLNNYDAIRRLVSGADADLYVYRKKIKDSDDPYLVTISGSWAARIPFSPEPFTVSELVPDPTTGQPKRQKVVTMRGNTRHNVRVDLNWNVTKLLGFQIGYRYGSLPPLFEFVNHQVTIGLVFKAKYGKNHSIAD